MFKNMAAGFKMDVKEFKEKHPKVVKTLKVVGCIGAGAAVVLGGKAVYDNHLTIEEDDEDVIDSDAEVVNSDEESSDESVVA